ncbi:lytic transglycosylase domain-containing protein [Arcobacter sp. FWKO B]|uniref:lytic transglycosylase domain-containing protein n=1 Tax=Arcobacter sp. FWKO B TaxID=2593672 RepID=UPI0018A60572|nr:lytic transglycosylase domain-containing protein [Arcobacter sp. FWKO B]QOG12980.1 LysM peptidoglycan-binding domain-containing protein [Arcobacter sp. FWKO B]
MRVLFTIFLFSVLAFGNLISFNYDNREDIQILRELDIESEFIRDLELQSMYVKYLTQYKDYYIKSFNESGLLIPKLKEILKNEGIPTSILYLGMAESNFNLDAKSTMRAKGLWQFIPDTAKRFGLKNDEYLDERLDIEKSTLAAAKYLKYLHGIFGKWYLATIAYNCGEGRLIEGIVRLSIDIYCQENPEFCNSKEYIQYKDIISKYQQRQVGFSELNKVYNEVKKLDVSFGLADLSIVQEGISRQYIPYESRNHIKKIVSFAIMMNKNNVLEDANAHLLNRGISTPIVPVQVKGGVHLKNIADVIDVEYDTLISLNKHLKEQIVPIHKKQYKIYIPYESLNSFIQNVDNIKQVEYQVHYVVAGDNLGKIGKKYGISYKMLKEHNQLTSDALKINQKLIIPIPKIETTNKVATSKANLTREYIVKKGDTLGSIAKNNKIPLNKLVSDNKLGSTVIKEGDKLVIKN